MHPSTGCPCGARCPVSQAGSGRPRRRESREGVRPSRAVPGSRGAGCALPRKAPPQLGAGQLPTTSFHGAAFGDPAKLERAERWGRGGGPAPQSPRLMVLPGKGGGGGNAGGRAPEGPRGCRVPAPRPQFPITRLQKPRRGLRPPPHGFTSPPLARRGAGDARLRPPPIPTGAGTGALPAEGRWRGGGSDGAARHRPGPLSLRLRWVRGWGRAGPSPCSAKGGSRFGPRWGARRAGAAPTSPAAGARAFGKEGAGQQEVPSPASRARPPPPPTLPAGEKRGGGGGFPWAAALGAGRGASCALRAAPLRGRALTCPRIRAPRGLGGRGGGGPGWGEMSPRPPAADAGTAAPG